MFICLLLFLTLTHVSISASNPAIEHLEHHDPDIKEIFAQARLHTKPALAQCETFECIEKLLYQEEDEAIEKIANQCGDQCSMYPDEAGRKFHRQMKPVAIHDEECVGERLVHFTTKYLRQGGIDPKTVSIGCDKEFFKENPDAIACDTTMLEMLCPKISFNIDHPLSHYLQHFVSAHEVTHIKENHKAKSFNVRMQYFHYGRKAFAGKNGRKAFASKVFKSDFVAFERVQEKQADLFPLMRYEDRLILIELLIAKLPQCMEQFKDGKLNQQWHKSPLDATHPGCSELLPYVLQIEKVRANKKKKARV